MGDQLTAVKLKFPMPTLSLMRCRIIIVLLVTSPYAMIMLVVAFYYLYGDKKYIVVHIAL